MVAVRQIPLEVCPISNVRTRVVDDYAAHPFKRLDEAGVLLTVNSDDPALFGATLTDEYRLLATTFGYGPDDLERFVRNGVRASFLPIAEKARLLGAFDRDFAALRWELGFASPADF